jgi:heme oxygenase
LEIPDSNSNLVQKQLLEHTQQIVHIVQACIEEKDILEHKFESVLGNIEILETTIQTNTHRVDAKVAGVGSQMQLQDAVRQEIRSEVNILQAQDNHIVQEANVIFDVHRNELESLSKRITENASQILSVKATNLCIQRSLKDMISKIDQVNEVLNSIKNSL